MPRSEELQARLAQLKQAYVESLSGRAATLRQLWHSLRLAWDPATARQLQTLAHQLAGSGGSFGFADITEQARDLEHRLATCGDPAQMPSAPDLEALEAALESLCRTLLRHAPAGD
ncbi:MAG TPA: Hpt domain-containing protein [Candidatus Competibacteraceae bacterium]|nr:Hpt domain-containing protein [Candidatus Competibacteraceae bacterium]